MDGQAWAYAAGLLAIAVGAGLVCFMFPRRERERALLAEYGREDAGPPGVLPMAGAAG